MADILIILFKNSLDFDTSKTYYSYC